MVETYKNDEGKIGVLLYNNYSYPFGEMFDLDDNIQSRYDKRVVQLWLKTL